METGDSVLPDECYQCGDIVFVATKETAKDGWIRCERCGERIVRTADLAAAADDYEARTIRDKLGVDEFLNSRRVHNKATKTD